MQSIHANHLALMVHLLFETFNARSQFQKDQLKRCILLSGVPEPAGVPPWGVAPYGATCQGGTRAGLGTQMQDASLRAL